MSATPMQVAMAARNYTHKMLERVRAQFHRGEVTIFRVLQAHQRCIEADRMVDAALTQEVQTSECA